jgi:hypothetical protein
MTTNNSINSQNQPSGIRAPYVTILSQTASTSPYLEFTGLNSSLYRKYEFEFELLQPDTNSETLYCLMATAGGYLGAGNYGYSNSASTTAGAVNSAGGSVDQILLSTSGTIDNGGAAHGVQGTVTLLGFNKAVGTTNIFSSLAWYGSAGRVGFRGTGNIAPDDQNIVSIKFLFATGNILAGTITQYGIPI